MLYFNSANSPNELYYIFCALSVLSVAGIQIAQIGVR